jgi:hypothetical protein
MHLNPRYETRLVNGSGAPITTNPLWTTVSPAMAGSQPNLLSPEMPFYRQLSPQSERRIPSAPVQQQIYASYPDNKSTAMIQEQENQQKRVLQQYDRKQKTQSDYLDTNEFILRASNGQPLRNAQYSSRQMPGVTRDYRPQSMNVNSSMLDVYY